MNFFLLIDLKLLANFFSCLLNIGEYENFTANKYENGIYYWRFHNSFAEKISCLAKLYMKKSL